MASGKYVACPHCSRRFFIGEEFFVLPDARCHCPYCGHQFSVYGASQSPAPGASGR